MTKVVKLCTSRPVHQQYCHILKKYAGVQLTNKISNINIIRNRLK